MFDRIDALSSPPENVCWAAKERGGTKHRHLLGKREREGPQRPARSNNQKESQSELETKKLTK